MMRTAGLGVVLLMAGVATSAAADDVERGKDLAQRWCTDCHVIGPGVKGGDAGPPFEGIAARHSREEWSIRNAIALPHPPMPDLDLTAPEYEDLGAYIMSLAR